MSLDEIILSVSNMVNNPDIITDNNLVLTYSLPEKKHRQLHEEIFFKRFGVNEKPELSDEYELTIGTITVKFIKETEI
jgi:hypothetical protein